MSSRASRTLYVGNLPGDIREREVEDLFYKRSEYRVMVSRLPSSASWQDLKDHMRRAGDVEGKTVLKFTLCYGFRNLQNVVRKIKTGKCDYHFLEIMACPSGCLNGGGQIKPKPGQSGKDLIQSLETAYMEKENWLVERSLLGWVLEWGWRWSCWVRAGASSWLLKLSRMGVTAKVGTRLGQWFCVSFTSRVCTDVVQRRRE
uniref:Iron hydrogenase large subunit C-terminal domain-containing protein n=1 Tax=Cannabis sativa TaxID=3483 RepID=A0A803QJI6_CANSA